MTVHAHARAPRRCAADSEVLAQTVALLDAARAAQPAVAELAPAG